MKKCLFLCLVAACIMCVTSVVTAQQICSNQTGTNNGYFFSFWTNGGGSVCMTMGSGGQFSVTWSNCGNFVCGKGWNPGAVRSVTYSGTASGAQSMGLYGWTKNELIEYYIADMGGGGEGENKGTVTTDGGTYAIWKHQQVNQPSIIGTATFWQYKSCRNGTRLGGTISFGNHVNAWKNAGMNLGSTWDYQILAVEGWGGSSGNASITVGVAPTATLTQTATITQTRTATLTATLTRTITTTPAPTVKKGDVNSDGSITIVDALMIAQYYVGLNPANFNSAAADVNCDGTITIVDALVVAQYYVGLLTGFSC